MQNIKDTLLSLAYRTNQVALTHLRVGNSMEYISGNTLDSRYNQKLSDFLIRITRTLNNLACPEPRKAKPYH
jgi:hypothetical protein